MKKTKTILLALLCTTFLSGCTGAKTIDDPEDEAPTEIFEEDFFSKQANYSYINRSKETKLETFNPGYAVNYGFLSETTITERYKNDNLYFETRNYEDEAYITKKGIAMELSEDPSKLTNEIIDSFFMNLKGTIEYEYLGDDVYRWKTKTENGSSMYLKTRNGSLLADQVVVVNYSDEVHSLASQVMVSKEDTELKYTRSYLDILKKYGKWDAKNSKYNLTMEDIKNWGCDVSLYEEFSASATIKDKLIVLYYSYTVRNWKYEVETTIKLEKPNLVFPSITNTCKHENVRTNVSYGLYNDEYYHVTECLNCRSILDYEKCTFDENSKCKICNCQEFKKVILIPEIECYISVDPITSVFRYEWFDRNKYLHPQWDSYYKLSTDDFLGYDFNENEKIYYNYLFYKDGVYYDAMFLGNMETDSIKLILFKNAKFEMNRYEGYLKFLSGDITIYNLENPF